MEASQDSLSSTSAHHVPGSRRELAIASLGALGVVYGDIGTSPLYAMKECFSPASHHHANAADPTEVFGVLSLMVWSLLLVVVVKYLMFVLRADNKGEGGTLALAALVNRTSLGTRRLAIPILLALFGTGLLYGEGLITPAISVISAVEGLRDQNQSLSQFVVPITVIILVALFSVQRYGTGRIGAIFGWIMLLWFVSIGVLGMIQIVDTPSILKAASPHYAIIYITTHGWNGFLLLGSVVLAVTGADALYADMGHFGRTPILAIGSSTMGPALPIASRKAFSPAAPNATSLESTG
jgi:KUP system potassium uptake protein